MAPDDSELSKLLSSASLVFMGTLIGTFGKLLERVIIGQMLSPSAYGEFSIGLTVLLLGTTLCAAGFLQGIPRFMARFDDREDVRGVWLTGAIVAGGISIAIASALFVLAPYIFPRISDSSEATGLFRLFVVTMPILVCFRVGIATVRGLENTRFKILAQNLIYPGSRLLLLVTLISVGVGVLATGVSYLLSASVSLVVVYLLLSRVFELRGSYRLHAREMVTFSAPLVVSTMASLLLTRTDTLMLGYFTTSRKVGIYNAAHPVAGALVIALSAFGYLYLPLASRLDSEKGYESVGKVYEITTKWMYVLVFPLFLVLVTFPGTMISIVFGPEYTAGSTALIVLSIGFFTNAAAGRNRETLSALGFTNQILLANAVAFVLNFVANLLLIPRYGYLGAAFASAFSYVSLNVVVYFVLRRRTDISPFTSSSVRAFVTLPIVLLPLSYAVRTFVGRSIPVAVAFGALSVVVTLVVVTVAGAVEAEDVILVEFVEDRIGYRLPLVRNFIPAEETEIELG